MMIIWCMVPEISSTTDFFVISGYFLSFYPPNNPENQNFGTMKKSPGGIIILNMSTIDENHMMYDSWDMEHNRQIFFLILDYFLLFYIPLSSPLTTHEKNSWRYHHFTQMHQKSRSYAIFSSDKTSDRCNCYFSLWAICFLWCQFMMQLMYRHFRVQFDDSWFIFHSSSWHFHESYFCWKQIFHKSYRVDKTQDNGL